MGQPMALKASYPALGGRRTRGTETSKYPEEKKTKRDFPSSGERTGSSPNPDSQGYRGVVGPRYFILTEQELSGKVGHRG
jgi:hypothetical protein